VRPCLTAFPLPRGAPVPAAPPCRRQRWRKRIGWFRQPRPPRVRAPQRGALATTYFGPISDSLLV